MGGFATAAQIGGKVLDTVIGGGGLFSNILGAMKAERQRRMLLEQSYADIQRRTQALNAQYAESQRRQLDLLYGCVLGMSASLGVKVFYPA